MKRVLVIGCATCDYFDIGPGQPLGPRATDAASQKPGRRDQSHVSTRTAISFEPELRGHDGRSVCSKRTIV